MLNALIVEDDAGVLSALRDLVELDSRYRVVAVAEDLPGALRASDAHHIDCAIVDIVLARRSSGYGVACALAQRGIRCVFVTGSAPPFPMPEFAVGCLLKPCTANAVHCALDMMAESITTAAPSSVKMDAGFVPY